MLRAARPLLLILLPFGRALWRGAAGLVLLALVGLPQPAGAEGMPYGQGLLWQVERDGALVGHVFGTIHLSDERMLTLPEPVADRFEAARRVVFELVIGPDERAAMSRAMLLEDGRRLPDLLGPDLFARTARLAAGYGLPPRALEALKPWALLPVISVPPDEFARSARGAKALDEALQARARGLGKELLGLETAAEQLAVFDGLPERDQVAMLAEVVGNHAETLALHEEMKRLYLARDLDGIYGLMLEQSAGRDERLARAFERRAVVARNRVMAGRLVPLLADGGLFVAVGALHLPGRDGILSRLAARGYQVSRIY